MPFAKEYEGWEVRAIIKECEGEDSPVTGAAAHARHLHGLSPAGHDGATGGGTTSALMHDRTHKRTGESNSQWSNRGGNPRTSAFGNLLYQAAAVTQAFNSPTGQAGLAVFDDPGHAGKKLRLILAVSGIKESTMSGSGGVTGHGAAPKMKKIHKSESTVTTVPGAAGVSVIVDKGPATTKPFIQTCFPLDVCPGSSYVVLEMPSKAELASG